MAALQTLGARSVPVVSKGDKFVFAQNVRDVVEFLGINEDVGPKLTQAELAARGDMIWQAATRMFARCRNRRWRKNYRTAHAATVC